MKIQKGAQRGYGEILPRTGETRSPRAHLRRPRAFHGRRKKMRRTLANLAGFT